MFEGRNAVTQSGCRLVPQNLHRLLMVFVSLVPALKGSRPRLCRVVSISRADIQLNVATEKGFGLMKKFFALIALVCCAAPATANDNLLSSLGLAGLEEVSVQEANEVAGRGFVYAYGTSATDANVADFSAAGTMSAWQELELQGLNALEGITGAQSSFSYDLSSADSMDLMQIQGSLNVGAATVVAGAAR